jgi:streptogrisin C
VRVVATSENPVPLYDVRGGDAYYMGGRCSVGFSVSGGFVTAGHCGTTGTATQGYNQVAQGTFRGSSFPGNDYAWVQVNSNWTPQPWVNNYAGGNVTVAGSTEAAVGASICRSGSTTGWRCGTVQAKNSTVNYPQGTVTGLTRTNACAEPGDSGGSWLSGQQAQGVTSGGSGNCSSGGTTYFQPVNEILSVYGLTLTTSGGGEPPPPTGCSGYEFTRSGSLGSGASVYQPDGSYYYSSASGTHRACLDGPSGVDFDVYLQKWNGSAWANVASGTTPNPDETVSYSGTAGYYRYRVHAYSGSGSYTLGFSNP